MRGNRVISVSTFPLSHWINRRFNATIRIIRCIIYKQFLLLRTISYLIFFLGEFFSSSLVEVETEMKKKKLKT